MMRRLQVYLVALTLLVGCSDEAGDGDPWPLHDPAEGAVPEPVGTSEDGCFESTFELFDAPTSRNGRNLTVADGRVFLGGYLESNDDLDVLEWTGNSLETFERTEGVDDIPYAASAGRLWTVGEEFRGYDVAGGGEPVVVDFDAAGLAPRLTTNNAVPPPRFSDGSRVAYLYGNSVWVVSEGSETLRLTGGQAGPWVGDEGIAWYGLSGAMAPGPTGIRFTEFDGETKVLENDQVAWARPVALGTTVVYRFEHGIGAWDTLTDETTILIEDVTCGPLYGDREWGVVGCEPGALTEDGQIPGYRWISMTEIWIVDGEEATHQYTSPDGFDVVSPVISDHWIAWLEFEAPVTLAKQGRVMVMAHDGGEPFHVANLRFPCWLCDDAPDDSRSGPPARLDLDGDTLAFNYANRQDDLPVDPDLFGFGGLVGVVRLSDRCN